MPEISVIIPVWVDSPDKITWLDECLASIQRQTFGDWEAIIVDDKSPMLLGEVKMKYQDDPRFRWFAAGSNQGPALCRNTAAALAESDCLVPLDADDQLGSDTALEDMFSVWTRDTTRIIYGNLQRLEISGNQFVKGKVYQLPEYTFQRAMDLNGIMPVTAMHSADCHKAAGGWKMQLDAGREDVEYWIAAGKAGYCGQRINTTTLLYRRHQESRDFALKRINRRENEMRTKIIEMHKDVFEGRFPMGCCGGSRNQTQSTAVRASSNGASAMQTNTVSSPGVGKITTLDGFRPDELVWVEYRGPRKASFQVAGRRFMVDAYLIQGTGHKFQVHVNDIEVFKRSARGTDYLVGIPDPTLETIMVEPEPKVEVREEEREYQAPAPRLATIERYDEIAARSRGIPVGAEATPPPDPVPLPQPPQQQVIGAIGWTESDQAPEPVEPPVPQSQTYDLSPLDLPESLQAQLALESWSLERLAKANKNELLGYKGIGPKRAEAIIEMAQRVTGLGTVPDNDLSLLNLPEHLEQKLKSENWTLPELAKLTPAVLESIPGIGLKRAEDIIEMAKRATGAV